MPNLSISEFSCIREANLSVSPVNVIIGPQGSGKSVTTKLLYFFSDILSAFLQSAERGDSIEDYKKNLGRNFVAWFPPTAWGNGRFNISYSAGLFSARILRRRSQGRLTDNIAITFSEWFTETYKQAVDVLDKSRSGDEIENTNSIHFSEAMDRLYRVRETVYRQLSRELGTEHISQQTFIPAGRAFFTSIGRLVAGFEQAGSLDPVTIKFARLFADIRDRKSRRLVYRSSRNSEEFLERRSRFMTKLFGGEIKFENDAEFVEAEDGRRIPFNSLSSGQQELLPMWSLVDYFAERDDYRASTGARRSRGYREIVYIEEPEAHLFPSAQSLLMEFLIGSVASEKNGRSLIITTHSPYIMSNLNLFLKAGQIAKKRKRNQDLNDIVPRECWLQDNQLSAFAIEDNKMRNLLDEDGLIDGTYLDKVSESLAYKFSELLQIETEI